jgi:hypothetical protein
MCLISTNKRNERQTIFGLVRWRMENFITSHVMPTIPLKNVVHLFSLSSECRTSLLGQNESDPCPKSSERMEKRDKWSIFL